MLIDFFSTSPLLTLTAIKRDFHLMLRKEFSLSSEGQLPKLPGCVPCQRDRLPWKSRGDRRLASDRYGLSAALPSGCECPGAG